MAEESGKLYLASGAQQDAEEFLSALIGCLTVELVQSVSFTTLLTKMHGSEKVTRKFEDTDSGVCCWCGYFPSCREEQFLTLKVTVPNCARVSLSFLLLDYFTAMTDRVNMKCSRCCPHTGSTCPQTGRCSRSAVTQHSLTVAPKYLFVQLLRFGDIVTGNKVNTLVEAGDDLELYTTDKYELVAALDHRGSTISSGHYVTYTKQDTGTWLQHNDTTITPALLDQVNTGDNYILLYKKKTTPVTPESIPTDNLVDPDVPLPSVPVDDGMENTVMEEKVNEINSNGLLDNECRGCGKIFVRLLQHLMRKTGEICLTEYEKEEIELHKKTANSIKCKKQYNGKRDEIKKKRQIHYEDNRETIAMKKQIHYEDNRETIAMKKQIHYEDNRETIARKKQIHYEVNQESIAKKKQIHYEVNQESIAKKRQIHYEDNRETIARKKQIHYEVNQESIAKKKQIHYEVNQESIAKKRQIHYEDNRETIARKKQIHYEVNQESIAKKKQIHYEVNQESIAKKRQIHYEDNRENYC